MRLIIVAPDIAGVLNLATLFATSELTVRMVPRISLGTATIWRYTSDRAVVVVEGAPPCNICHGTTTMIIIGILLNFAGLGVLCWAMFRLAVYALPFFVGMTAGLYAFQTGAGPLGAIVVGVVVSAFALVAGQHAFAGARSTPARLVIGLLFTFPAAVAGYQLTLGFAHLGVDSEGWRQAFALIGAVCVGSTAWARIAMLAAPPSMEGVHASSAQPPLESATISR
jgi:hypothetical protein